LLPVSASFFALRTANSKPDHIPVRANLGFREFPAKEKDVNSQEKEGKRNKCGYDDEQL
jgi:hypothetical protein